MVGTVDCGDMAAKWLSKYMLDQDSGVRLGYHLADSTPRRVVAKKFKHCFKTLQDSDLVTCEIFCALCAILILC
jgi:hypothetical protein